VSDMRLLLMFGLGLTAWAMYAMTGWTPTFRNGPSSLSASVQGAGLAFSLVPLNTVAFSTIPQRCAAREPGYLICHAMLDRGVGISAVTSLIAVNTQINHASIAAYVTHFNHAFDSPRDS